MEQSKSISKNIVAKEYTPNRSEEVLVIKRIQNTVPWTYVFNDLNGEETIGLIYEKKIQKKFNQDLG